MGTQKLLLPLLFILTVSIQLISPASGDSYLYRIEFSDSEDILVSIQLISPASGDQKQRVSRLTKIGVSIQLISPASGDERSSA